MKRGKSRGEHYLINKYFIDYDTYLIPILRRLFNCVLSTGFFPKSWVAAVTIPGFEKGDNKKPGNYRGISLISCFCKPFTTIINKSLFTWSEVSNVITDAQLGVRPHLSQADAIFSIIIQTYTTLKYETCQTVM